jgi:hypothetical protein
MRLGIDFDNTLACYDGAFHSAAVERGLIPASVATDKTSVRDYLRADGRDHDFTALQGYVYGPGMRHVSVYPGVLDGLKRLRAAGCELMIVSHKTRTPFAGPAYDLHAAAREFLAAQGLVGTAGQPFAEGQVHLELTLAEKVERIGQLGCAAFIDDLPEVLEFPGFPASARRILFDPGGRFDGDRYERYGDWPSMVDGLLAGTGG